MSLTGPDENYAREIMQLFTIGLVKLNMDGTSQLDRWGREINTYTSSPELQSDESSWENDDSFKKFVLSTSSTLSIRNSAMLSVVYVTTKLM